MHALGIHTSSDFLSFTGAVTKFSPAALSNGIGWNLSEDTLYHVDSFGLKLYQYAYDKQTGIIKDQKLFIDFSPFASESSFGDGMCTDTEGRLWVAMFNQSVKCWDPTGKEILLSVNFPKAKRITSCCFGGPNYEWLFVTTAKILTTEDELAEYTNSGAVFVVKDLGARGRPPNKFKLSK